MNREQNIARFEAELAKVDRPGMDRLLEYIRKSDFYTAPASTRFHLSCEGGLLQHSLNVLVALRGLMPYDDYGHKREYRIAGQVVAAVPDESVIITALLHDICKTHFYTKGFRWYKDENNKWQQAPTYTIEDKMPLGHGDKSAMIIMQYIKLTNPEMYAIWWHMGITDGGNIQQFGQAIDKFPIVYALHTADMIASHFMEAKDGNVKQFTEPEATAPEFAAPPSPEDEDAEPVFEEAPAL